MRLVIRPISLADANAFVAAHHRHHDPVVGHRFSLAARLGETVVGVAIVGRPVARGLDDGETLEVTRVATDGTRNACSALYGAATRAARELGYRKVVTYILADELGTSLRAAGWSRVAEVRGRPWTCVSRPRPRTANLFGDIPRSATVETKDKVRWERSLR